jgi:hypothetical protein
VRWPCAEAQAHGGHDPLVHSHARSTGRVLIGRLDFFATADLPCVQWISDSLEDSLGTRGQLQQPALVAAGNRWRFIGRASLSGVLWQSLRSRAGNDCDVALAQVPPAEDAHGLACQGMVIIIGRLDRPWAVLARLPNLSKRNSLHSRELWDGDVQAPRAIRIFVDFREFSVPPPGSNSPRRWTVHLPPFGRSLA